MKIKAANFCFTIATSHHARGIVQGRLNQGERRSGLRCNKARELKLLADAEALCAFLGACESPDTVRCIELTS